MNLELDGSGQAAVASPHAAWRQLQLLQFGLHRPGDASRAGVEAYIRSRFAAVHGAQVTHFLPQLISVGQGEHYCAAVGLAHASRGRLFAETYLAAPVHECIAQRRGETVSRSEVLEIGNLVSTWKGSSLLLFVFLSELIDRLGHRFVLFTATPEVERLLARLGYTPDVLTTADPARLPDRGAQWGRYYDRAPRVMYGEVRPAVAAARRDLLYRGTARSIAAAVDRSADALREC